MVKVADKIIKAADKSEKWQIKRSKRQINIKTCWKIGRESSSIGLILIKGKESDLSQEKHLAF